MRTKLFFSGITYYFCTENSEKMILMTLLALAGLAYTLWRIWIILPLDTVWKILIIGGCLAAFLSLFLNFMPFLGKVPLWMSSAIYEIGTSSIFILLYLVMIFVLLDLGRLVHLVPETWLASNGWTSLCILTAIVGIFLYGNIHYKHKVRQPIELTTEKHLDKDLKIVMISDLHLGYHNRRADFAKWVDAINAEKPDLILIGGDIVDINVQPLIRENVAEEFDRLDAPVYACLGNHEYYSGIHKALPFYKDAGINLLRDSVVTIGRLRIIGRDDRSNPRRKDLDDLMNGIADSLYTILLDHQPYHLEDAENHGIDFQFSGHTHRGQIWPASWITDRLFEDSWGEHRRGATRYYVSSGIGIWGGKFRIGTRSEYVVATLRSVAAK